MQGLALTTPATSAETRASAVARSRSTWSSTAMSPRRSRGSRASARRSTLATPVTPGSAVSVRRRRASLMRVRVPSDYALEAERNTQIDKSVLTIGAVRGRSVLAVGRARAQHLLRVRPAELGVVQAGEHPGQLPHPAGVVEHPDVAAGDQGSVGV